MLSSTLLSLSLDFFVGIYFMCAKCVLWTAQVIDLASEGLSVSVYVEVV